MPDNNVPQNGPYNPPRKTIQNGYYSAQVGFVERLSPAKPPFSIWHAGVWSYLLFFLLIIATIRFGLWFFPWSMHLFEMWVGTGF